MDIFLILILINNYFITESVDSSKEFEDELSDIPLPIVSPDFTLLDFEPPPPIFSPTSLQHASVDQRLPPLGALGQASSSPIPSSRRHNRSLSPGTPPPPHRSSLFRPLPQRYNYINRQGKISNINLNILIIIISFIFQIH